MATMRDGFRSRVGINENHTRGHPIRLLRPSVAIGGGGT